nr:transketolase [Candidatus Omnitrophota bacterium]
MSDIQIKAMRDSVIDEVYSRMRHNKRIFFISADLGAPSLDKLRKDFKDRFINVGIAEQNLINVSTGLALEGFTVYAYAIASFITMRAYEQIRTNLSLSSHHKEINVNLIGAGSGVSYDVSGPSHHCIEDITIMRALPNILFFSPSDWFIAEKFVDFSINTKGPKYMRLDGKPLPRIYDSAKSFDFKKGFCELVKGDDVCIVSTGYMTHKALKIAKELCGKNRKIGVIDMYILKPVAEDLLFNTLKRYKRIITIEEAFINKGGLDSLISNMISRRNASIKLISLGFDDNYIFKFGNRDFLSSLSNFSEEDIIKVVED